jgi:uncharacterized membrane protein
MIDKLKAYSLKVVEGTYRASVGSILTFCAILFLMAIIAMAINMKAIDVQQIHTKP